MSMQTFDGGLCLYFRSKSLGRLSKSAGGITWVTPILSRTGIGGAGLVLFALLAGGAGNADAACTPAAPVVTCTGDVSAGASFGAPVDTLNINSLTVNAGSISLDRSGGNGSGGSTFPALGEDGDNGGGGSGATVNYVGGTNNIVVGGIGIAVRSNGGNGGSGGDGVGFTIPIPVPPFIIPVPGFGGDGGAGGNGGTVFVTSNGSITTTGISSHGILAEANAGNGGNGGDSISILSLFGEGGTGGRGGTGGSVTVQNNGAITTNGTTSQGIFATSRGGVGGAGGDAGGLVAVGGAGAGTGPGGMVAVTSTNSILTKSSGSNGIFAQSVGGFGGGGGGGGGLFAYGGSGESAGDGGTVTVTNSGTITTQGTVSNGILAQSIGGGGGSGGIGGGLVGLGGSGNAAGAGGLVTVNNQASGTITTVQDKSIGIFAQSVGGGGGDGGSSGGIVSVGGSGAGGGSGSTVKVNNSGALSTSGKDASAIFAQSIGGGGGNGGTAISAGPGLAVAIGGSADAGGSGGIVIVNETIDANTLVAASIQTTNDRSNGIQAQSVGGGGGNGGLAVAGSIGGGFSASVALGGTGGGGGASNAVTVNEKGTIITGGTQANGIFAQSVGGGGGNGGGSVAVAASGGYSLGFAMGGQAGGGGGAGTVTVNAVGNITTTGGLSHGVFAQSVGGGGGNGGFSVAATGGSLSGSLAFGGGAGVGGVGNNVTVNVSGAGFVNPTVSTTTDGSAGIFAQSVGGGGGNGGFAGTLGIGAGAVSVGLGGVGAGGAVGGTVHVTNSDAVKTSGNNAAGIFAQSVGGGGGNGGFALSASGGAISVAAAVGGGGGAGSDGGVVTVDNFGNITTIGSLSHGILAQSVGGGGGNGGFAISGALGVSVEDIPGGAAAISVGGKGGGASNGEMVTVNNHGNIETSGLGAHAIFAQSVGGGGGNGGFAGSVAMTLGGGAAFGISVGGPASGGGDAGEVHVASTGTTIITHKDGADGIHAQSIGGGGGDGGFAAAGAFGFGGEVNVNVAVAIGGAGGVGGKANTVDVNNQTAIATFGKTANGIFAQSVGGGGGNGGLSVTGTLGLSETTGNVGVTVGGAGGSGNTANNVTITNAGSISTTGIESIGIFGQSIGGSGGNGGLALSAELTGATKTSATVGVSVGGGGGDGNNAGEVKITNNAGGEILTSGFGAHGIKGQSIGGGGGNGGMAIVGQVGVAFGTEEQATKTLNVGVAVGGSGGDASYGNLVHVINKDSIEVMGDTATGIFAQSVGGGGGDGGGALNAIGMLTDSTNKDSRSVVATVTVGGGGGTGSNGGVVTVDNTGSITTHGVSGYGVYAQSVGGGGGIGGRANTFALVVTDACTLPVLCTAPASTKNNFQLGVTVGGNGGGASNGGGVTVNNQGEIETFGNTSDGIYAQSIGGGGGAGGNGILGSGEILPVPVELAFIPVGSVSFYKNLQVVVGGSAGSSGNGGIVEVNNDKNITTHGSNSNGIFAQSVGGGGGVGGKAAIGATGTFGLGGAGGAAGNGGDVTVKQLGGATIETFGAASNGIFAQSVGGGGGVAGNVDRALAADIETPIPGVTIPALNLGIGLAFGRSGGGGGDGGIVDVNVDGHIITHGNNAAGIFAQSVGGGGGVLGELGNDVPVLSLLSWQIGSAGDAGNAGRVDVNLTGSIVTAGNNATGIFAQSAGGTGTAGAVNVTLNSSILTGEVLTAGDETRGLGSIGILAQSAASNNANNGNIMVAINSTDGVVRGGRSLVVDDNRAYIGVGIWVMDGKDNTITNNGLVTTLGGVGDGFAILGTGSDSTHPGGNETVFNFGTVTGNVDLGSGNNAFNNKVGALFNSGKTINLGAGNLLTNDGTLSPGESGNVFTTALTGNMLQSATGTYAVDLDVQKPSDEADRINVSGTANLAGKVGLTIVNPGFALPGSRQATILSAAGNVTDHSSLALDSPTSAVATYQLLYPNPNDVVLDYAIDFSPASGLNINQTMIGNYINRVQLAGGSASFAPIVEALFFIPDASGLASAYDHLSPEPYVGLGTGTFFSNLQFSDSMLSCRSRDGQYRFVQEGQCGWMTVSGSALHEDRTSENLGFNRNGFSVAGGLQKQISENWHVGAGIGYDRSWLDVHGIAESDANQLQGGAIVKGQFGPAILSATVSGGHGWYDAKRFVNLPVTGVTAKADPGINFVANRLRLAYAFEQPAWYLKPMIDAGVTYVHLGGFRESGAPGANLNVRSQNETYVTLQPALEVGGELGRKDGLLFRPFARFGLIHLFTGDSPGITASMQGAPAGVAPFTVKGKNDRNTGEVSLGVDILGVNGMNLRVGYSGQFSPRSESHGGAIKFSIPF